MLSANSLKCNISRKKWMMKSIFGLQINIDVFYKLMLSFWVCATRHAQSTQNNKFVYLCNIPRKAWGRGGVKWIFCLQINTKVFFKLTVLLWVSVSRHAQSTQTISLQYLCNISRKTWRMNLIFCLHTNMKSFFKLP